MKKIMFNDRFGLTDAVLRRIKTMTRRELKVPIEELNDVNCALHNGFKEAIIKKYAPYAVGEVLAVAQSYSVVNEQMMDDFYNSIYDAFKEADDDDIVLSEGYNNKMFVSASLMPHQIKMIDLKLERMQDIDEIQASKEGIQTDTKHFTIYQGQHGFYDNQLQRPRNYNTPRLAFAGLIDLIGGKGTWESNPWVFAYEFKLIR